MEGNILEDTDGKGNAVLNKYDPSGRLTERREPEIKKDGNILYSVRLFSYDLMGRKTEEKRSCMYAEKNSYPDRWNSIKYSYDKNGRLIKVQDGTGAEEEYEYDCMGRRTFDKIKINDKKFKKTRYVYTKGGRLKKKIEYIDAEDIDEKNEYNEKELGAETKYIYNKLGDLIKEISPLGLEKDYYYDGTGKLVQVTEDSKYPGQAAEVTLYKYNKCGDIVKVIDAEGRSTEYEYDVMRRVIRLKNKEGGITRIFYDSRGNAVKYVSPENYDLKKDDGAGTVIDYDSLGRILSVKNPIGDVIRKNEYNRYGELEKVTDASGLSTTYTYDLGGRRKSVTTPKAAKLNRVSETLSYDALSNITGITDGEGNRTGYVLDPWGRIKRIDKADGSSENYGYDYAGNITSTEDGNGHTIRYGYNSLNKVSVIKDQMGFKEYFKYDIQGRMASFRNRNDVRVDYSYNGDRLIKRRTIGADGMADMYGYNKDGILSFGINNNIGYDYEYTKGGRLKSKKSKGRTLLEYEYNKDGKVSSIKDAGNRKVTYKYDIAGRIKEVWNGKNKDAEYRYNKDSTLSCVKLGNGINISYDYDEDKNITGILAKNAAGNTIFNYKYEYDADGNQIEKIENNETTRYSYDPAGRLSKAEYPKYSEEFKYDKAGNRIKRIKDGIEEKYTYNNRNQLYKKESGKEITDYVYDLQGNLIYEKDKKGITQYKYNDFNQTKKIIKPDGSFQRNFYDPEGLRSSIIENNVRSNFVFDRGNIITESDGEDNVKVSYTRGLGLISQINNKGAFYYLNNNHGDVAGLSDLAGNIVNSYKYDAFGNTVSSIENISNRFRYAGEQYDQITNQYYLRSRFYNPVIGRFTQEDTYRGDGLNLYEYVHNNPVKYVDPSGNICESKEDIYKNNEMLALPAPEERLMLPEGVSNVIEVDIKIPDYVKLSEQLGKKVESEGYKIINIEDAVQANKDWADMGYNLPPVAENTKAYNVEAGNFEYARVFKKGVNNPKSPFILRSVDIKGISASKIAEKYALPQVPDSVVYPHIPSDAPLEVSIVGPQKSWGTIGGYAQYAIKDVLLDDDWFTDIHPLN